VVELNKIILSRYFGLLEVAVASNYRVRKEEPRM
jgi:hypothetical protein